MWQAEHMTEPDSAPMYDITASIHVAADPFSVYDVASDITRMGEWSPESTGGDWAEGERGTLGSRFQGHNRVGDSSWTTECEVVAAQPGRRFAWAVLTSAPDADTSVWSFEIEPQEGGALLTQRYVMRQPPGGLLQVKERLSAEQVATFFEDRRSRIQKALKMTIAGIKASVEGRK